jgi:hypothetical protein
MARSDLSFVVNQSNQFIHAPKIPHLKAINRILRYLKSSSEKEIWMKNNCTNAIRGYFNADWVGSFNRKSITDFCTFINENLVTWKNKK